MDFALDTSETPSRAFTLDVIADVQSRRSALNIQQFYVGVGGVAGKRFELIRPGRPEVFFC